MSKKEEEESVELEPEESDDGHSLKSDPTEQNEKEVREEEKYEDFPYVSPLQAVNLLSPTAANALMTKEPGKLLDFVEGYDKRQFELAKLQEENQHKEENTRQSNRKFMFVIVTIASVFVFIASLIYATRTDDKTLPKDLLNYVLALGGGSGLTYGYIKSQNSSNDS